jgi:hypothetical protein
VSILVAVDDNVPDAPRLKDCGTVTPKTDAFRIVSMSVTLKMQISTAVRPTLVTNVALFSANEGKSISISLRRKSPDGDTIIELKVKPEQVPNILNNLGISEKASELIDVRNSASVDGKAMIPDDYGVQLQINLTVEETGALNPSVTLNVQPTHKIFLL